MFLEMVENQSINCLSGKKIKCQIDSICIHGDNIESLETAKQIKKVLEENNIYLKPLNNLKKFLYNMKKIILIIFISFYSSIVFAAGSGGGEKNYS